LRGQPDIQQITSSPWYCAVWDPPTVAVTKRKFLEAYSKPISGIYDAVLQELLVQQHLIRYQKRYKYDPVRGILYPGLWCFV
jgi:hypothetical protein